MIGTLILFSDSNPGGKEAITCSRDQVIDGIAQLREFYTSNSVYLIDGSIEIKCIGSAELDGQVIKCSVTGSFTPNEK